MGEYAVLGVIYLTKKQDRKIYFVREIAQTWDLPESFLAKIFQKLSKSGILASHRGSGGGFSLARPPEKISLKEVLEAVQGPIALNWCMLHQGQCGKFTQCALEKVFSVAQEKVIEVLERTTLAALATGMKL